jgi:hypothetical protein
MPNRKEVKAVRIEQREGELWAELFFDDLSSEAQEKLLKLLGDNGNFDVFPIAAIM